MDLLNYISQKNKKDIKIQDNNINPKPFNIITPKIKDDLKNIKIIDLKTPIIKELDKIPNNLETYKIEDMDKKKYNFLVFGIDDPIFYNNKTNKSIDNKFLYGDPSPKELMISNFQTESGTSNNLQNKLLQNQTGESLDDINEANETIDNVYKNEIDRLMNKLNKEKEKNSLSLQPEYLKEIKNQVVEEETSNNIEKLKNKKLKIKANIKPVIQNAIYSDDKKQKIKENEAKEKINDFVKNIKDKKVNKEKNDAATKIQNFSKNIKAKKEGKEMIKNIVDNINKDLRRKDLQNESNKKINELKQNKEEHKKKLNKVFDEANRKLNNNLEDNYPKKNDIVEENTNPMIQKLEEKKNKKGNKQKNYTPEEALLLTNIRNAKRREAYHNKKAMLKASKELLKHLESA